MRTLLLVVGLMLVGCGSESSVAPPPTPQETVKVASAPAKTEPPKAPEPKVEPPKEVPKPASRGWRDPVLACDYLESEGMNTFEYRSTWGKDRASMIAEGLSDDFSCGVPGKKAFGEDPISTLTYSVYGTEKDTRFLYLELFANTKKDINSGKPELARLSDDLHRKAGIAVPDGLKDSILKVKRGKFTLDGIVREVRTDSLNNKVGMTVRVCIYDATTEPPGEGEC